MTSIHKPVSWFGLIGPNEDGLKHNVTLFSWSADTQDESFEGSDQRIVTALERMPYSKDGETKFLRINERFVCLLLRRNGASIGLAALGTNELELDIFLEHLERMICTALGVDSIKTLSVANVRANAAALEILTDDMLSHGTVSHLDATEATKVRKAMISTLPPKTNRS